MIMIEKKSGCSLKDVLIRLVFKGEDINLPLTQKDYKYGSISIFRGRNKDEGNILIAGLGDKLKLDGIKIRYIAGNISRFLISNNYESAYVEEPYLEKYIGEFCEGMLLGSHRYLDHKSEKPQKFDLNISKNIFNDSSIKKAIAVAEGVNFARDLSNTPPNILYPEAFCNISEKHFKDTKVEVKIYRDEDIKRENFIGLSSVGAGSKKSPRMVELRYIKDNSKPTVAFVGKGVTFDMGGMNVKPSTNIVDMKMDMSGASAVIGAIHAISELDLNVNIVGLIPLAENLADANALIPGSIIKYPNDISVEIGNTDAEGRLILADALIYANKQGIKTIIDLATLTGSMVAALGTKIAGAFGNDCLVDELIEIGNHTGDRLWKMPLLEDYVELIKSNHADICNIGVGKHAGSITAALFLRHFIDKNTSWSHLDIAGTMDSKKDHGYNTKGATGFGVKLLVEYADRLQNK